MKLLAVYESQDFAYYSLHFSDEYNLFLYLSNLVGGP